MKRNLKIALLAIGIMALTFTGCKKELMNVNPALTNFSETEIQALAVQSDAENEASEILYDEATNEMVAVNEGIAYDYLVTVEDFNNSGAYRLDSMIDARSTSNIKDHSFVRCLHGLKLEEDQIKKIRIALGGYNDCKASAIHRARAIHAHLVAKYKDLAHEQAKLLRAGKITKEEYEARIARIRHAFQKELRELQLKEKLNEALKDCYTKFLRQLNGILTERQWKAFLACHKK